MWTSYRKLRKPPKSVLMWYLLDFYDRLDKIYSEDVRGETETRRPNQCCTVIKEPMLAKPGPHSGSGLHPVAWQCSFSKQCWIWIWTCWFQSSFEISMWNCPAGLWESSCYPLSFRRCLHIDDNWSHCNTGQDSGRAWGYPRFWC